MISYSRISKRFISLALFLIGFSPFIFIYLGVLPKIVIGAYVIGGLLTLLTYLIRHFPPYREIMVILSVLYVIATVLTFCSFSKPLLYVTAEKNNPYMFSILLKMGFDPTTSHFRDSYPISTFEAAASNGSIKIVETLLKENLPEKILFKGFENALRSLDLQMVKLIVEEGVSSSERYGMASNGFSVVISKEIDGEEKELQRVSLLEYLVSVGGRIHEYDKNILIEGDPLGNSELNKELIAVRTIAYLAATANINGVRIYIDSNNGSFIHKYESTLSALVAKRINEYRSYCESHKCLYYQKTIDNYIWIKEIFTNRIRK